MARLTLIFAFLQSRLFASECARILAVSPLPAYSHQAVYMPIWRELSLRGHSVTLITADPIKDPSLINLTEIDVHDATYNVWASSGIIFLMKEHQKNPAAIAEKYLEVYVDLVDSIMNQKGVKKLLNSDASFDLVITEPVIFIGLGFVERYNTKLILLTSMEAPTHVHTPLGNPFHPVLYPERVLAITPDSYIKRVLITTLSIYYFWYSSYFHNLNTVLIRKYFGDDVAHVEEVLDRTNMLFANVNPIFQGVRPLTPSTIYFGRGSHLQPEKPLPIDFRNYLDAAKDGVLYFSLGSNVHSKDLPVETKRMLLETFEALPFKVLWKFEDDSLKGLPKNVKIAKWIPQQDVLRHSNLKIFLSQCGLQSAEEAIFSKVPIICIPQVGDQVFNAERIVELGMGLQASFDNMDKDNLKRMILEVVSNNSYRENMQHFVELSTDWPSSGIDDVVWWTEYVLRHNNTEHLKGPARKMPVYQYLLLDVVGGVLLLLSVAIYLSIKLVKWIWRVAFDGIVSKLHKD